MGEANTKWDQGPNDWGYMRQGAGRHQVTADNANDPNIRGVYKLGERFGGPDDGPKPYTNNPKGN